MRRIILSTLFLSTMLLHAQSSNNGQGVTFQARGESPNALAAPAAVLHANDASEKTQGFRISTGAVAPKLLKVHDVILSVSDFHAKDPSSQKLVLHFNVDQSGKPQNIQIVKPVNPDVDARVINAVSQYRYIPAKLDGQVVSSDLNLIMSFEPR
jgi:hypothetical protein